MANQIPYGDPSPVHTARQIHQWAMDQIPPRTQEGVMAVGSLLTSREVPSAGLPHILASPSTHNIVSTLSRGSEIRIQVVPALAKGACIVGHRNSQASKVIFLMGILVINHSKHTRITHQNSRCIRREGAMPAWMVMDQCNSPGGLRWILAIHHKVTRTRQTLQGQETHHSGK